MSKESRHNNQHEKFSFSAEQNRTSAEEISESKFDLNSLVEAADHAYDKLNEAYKTSNGIQKEQLNKALDEQLKLIEVLRDLENNVQASESQKNAEAILLSKISNTKDLISKAKSKEMIEKWKTQIQSLEKTLKLIRGGEQNNNYTSDKQKPKEQSEISEIREKLLEDLILEKGGFFLFTSLPKEYSQNNHSGFTNIWDSKRLDSNNSYNGRDLQFNREEQITKLGATELIRIEPVMKANYVTEEVIEAPKGMFSSFKSPVKKMKEVFKGNVAVNLADVLQGAEAENAYRLVYKVNDSNLPHDAQYQDYSGRPGQQFLLEILLPESVAKDALEQIKLDPKFIRNLAERFILEKTKITPEAWSKGDSNTKGIPIRPPYERWSEAQNGETKLYIQEKINDPIDKKFIVSVKA